MILSKKVSRAKLAEVVGSLAPKAIAMEACASAHYWARCWLAAGREVRLINPRFVKPFVRGSKNDAVDAEAIFEAATRPTMRFVSGKVDHPQLLVAELADSWLKRPVEDIGLDEIGCPQQGIALARLLGKVLV